MVIWNRKSAMPITDSIFLIDPYPMECIFLAVSFDSELSDKVKKKVTKVN